MTPTLGTLLTVKPREMQNAGKACTKFVVPSTGSTMKVGASERAVVGSPGTKVSSPMKEYVG